MRAATVAKRGGREVEFSLAAFRAAFVDGRDLGDPKEVAALAPVAGFGPAALLETVARQDAKDELRAATETAHGQGVLGVPTVVIGGQRFWGDDRLEEAAAAGQG
jgi:2-hydroxychromene-2-carboxylate isomerase